MSSTEEFRRIADALLAACGPVDGTYRYVGTVAPSLGVPLVTCSASSTRWSGRGLSSVPCRIRSSAV